MIRSVRLFVWGGPGAHPWARSGVLLEVDAGTVGLGEAAPLVGLSTDSLARCVEALTSLAWDAFEVPASPAEVASAPLAPPAARFALETALGSIAAERAGKSLAAWLGGKRVEAVPRSVLVGRVGDEAAIERARASVDRGVRSLKVKHSPALGAAETSRWLVELRAELRHLTADRIALRLDYNGALAPGAVESTLELLAPAELELVEEPCGGEGLLALGRCAVPWFADESLVDPDLRDRLVDHAAGVVLKPTLLGLSECWRLGNAALERGKQIVVTHAFEGPVGLAACASLALAFGARALAPGLDDHDVKATFAPWEVPQIVPGGRTIEPTLAPGLGLAPHELGTFREIFRWTRSR